MCASCETQKNNKETFLHFFPNSKKHTRKMVNVFTDGEGKEHAGYIFPLWALIVLVILLIAMLGMIIGLFVWMATKKTDNPTNQGPRGAQGFSGSQGPTGSGGGSVGTDVFPVQFDEFTIQRAQLTFSPTTMSLFPTENQFIRMQYSITTRRISPTTVRRNVVLSGDFGMIVITASGQSTPRFVVGFTIPPTVAGSTLASSNFTFVGEGASPGRVLQTPLVGGGTPCAALTEVSLTPNASNGIDCTLSYCAGGGALSFNVPNSVGLFNFQINYWHDDLLPQ